MSIIIGLSGKTNTHNLSLSIDTHPKYYHNLFHRYSKGNNVLEISDVPWSECTDKERASLLIHMHEKNHLSTIFSSPFGLLLWRCDKALSIGAGWFLSQIQCAGEERISLPLTKWYKENGGRNLMASATKQGRVAPHLLNEFGPNYAAELVLSKLDDLCEELEVICSFKEMLIAKNIDSKLSIQDFIKVANRCFHYLAERCDLSNPVRWRTLLPYSYPLYQKESIDCISGRHIVEASSRFSEVIGMACMGADPKDINSWYQTAIWGVYKNVFQGMLDSCIPFPPAYILCYLSLIGPIDPVCVQSQGDPIYVEKTLPWFRLKALIEAYEKNKIDPLSLSDVKGLQKIHNLAGLGDILESPFESALQNGLIGKNAKWTYGNYDKLEFYKYFDQNTKEILETFENHFRIKISEIHSGGPLSFTLQKVPEILYKDFFFIQKKYTEDDVTRQIAHLMRQMKEEYLISGIVYGLPVMDPKKYQHYASEGLKNHFKEVVDEKSIDKIAGIAFSIKNIAKFLPKVCINSLLFFN
jgi:hypothetical protein